jgi:hypothetical protein
MPRPHHPSAPPGLFVLLLGLGAAAGCGRAEVAPRASDRAASTGAAEGLPVRQGPFERHLTLTGEIDTVSAVELKVPRVPNGQVPIRYLAPEGAEVKAGDVVVELDSTTFVLEIKDRTLQLNQAEIDLQRQLSQNGVAEADKALDVERKRAAVRRAEVDADVPEGILPKRDYLEKQLVLERARADLARAEDALASQKVGAAADVKLKRIAVEKLRRAVDIAEQAIATLTLRTTEAGTVIINDQPGSPAAAGGACAPGCPTSTTARSAPACPPGWCWTPTRTAASPGPCATSRRWPARLAIPAPSAGCSP